MAMNLCWLRCLLLMLLCAGRALIGAVNETRVTAGLNQTENERKYLGICQLYKGTRCQSILNGTELRFVFKTVGFNKTESIADQFLNRFHLLDEKGSKIKHSKHCQTVIEKVICYYVFPPCSGNGEKLEYCREDCEYVFDTCGELLNQVIGVVTPIIHHKPLDQLFTFKGCTEYKSDKDSLGKNRCKHLPFIDLPSRQPEASSKKWLIIGCSCGAAVVLLIVSFLLSRRFCCHKMRSLSARYEDVTEEGLGKKDPLTSMVSVRDRIQERKIASSELLEILDICEARGVQRMAVDKIEYLKDLGSGQYGLVFQGKVNEDIEGETSHIVAVKTLREGSSEEAIKEFCQEVNIMSTFSHPNVVKLIGVSLEGEPYCMIFEFVEFGDLASFLRNCAEDEDDANSAYPKLNVTDQLAMCLQVATGMKYISSLRCVHRDLAARNCLVGRGLVVKISDFGLSRDTYASEYYRMDKSRMLPVRWLPPEAFVDGKFTTYSDVYSYGVLLWEVFTFAKLPYEDYDNNRTMELILEGVLLEKPDRCPTPVYHIMRKCWAAKPENRILFPEVIEELCSLDDHGERINADETDGRHQLVENYQGNMTSRNSLGVSYDKESNSLYYSNNSFSLDKHLTPTSSKATPSKAEGSSIPKQKMVEGSKLAYDGVVALPESVRQNYPFRGQPKDPALGPEAVHSLTPPPDTEDVGGSYGDNHRSDDKPPKSHDLPSMSQPTNEHLGRSRETYVPPETLHRQMSQNSGISGDDEELQETYDVPPTPQQTYDVHPAGHLPPMTPQIQDMYDEESEGTYVVPPMSHVPALSSNTTQFYPEEPQETYDVPPAPLHRQSSLNSGITLDDEGARETYDVPLKHHEESPDDLYQNSSELQTGYYSVPQSPYLQRRNQAKDSSLSDDNTSRSSSCSRGKAYENVGFDGRPLISS